MCFFSRLHIDFLGVTEPLLRQQFKYKFNTYFLLPFALIGLQNVRILSENILVIIYAIKREQIFHTD